MRVDPRRLLAAALPLVGLFGGAGDAHAIAAFTRQYNTECSTCHAPFPRRNEFGEAFRRNGYVWPGRPVQKPEGKEAFWLSAVPEGLPLSVTLYQDLLYDETSEDELAPDGMVQLHAGGTLRDFAGFFAHDLLADETAEAFIVFRRVAGTPVNVKYGRFAPQTTLWKNNQNVMVADLATAAFSVAGGGTSLRDARQGLEANAVLGRRLFAAAAVAEVPDQNAMDYAAHLSYKIAGTDLLGREPDLNMDEDSIWDYLTLTFGAYGYLGTLQNPEFDTRLRRAGVECEAQYRGFTSLVSAAFERDRNVVREGVDVDSMVLAAEADYFFAPRYLLALRYEHEDVGNASLGILRRAIADASWIPLESLLLKVEVSRVQAAAGEDRISSTALFRVEFSL